MGVPLLCERTAYRGLSWVLRVNLHSNNAIPLPRDAEPHPRRPSATRASGTQDAILAQQPLSYTVATYGVLSRPCAGRSCALFAVCMQLNPSQTLTGRRADDILACLRPSPCGGRAAGFRYCDAVRVPFLAVCSTLARPPLRRRASAAPSLRRATRWAKSLMVPGGTPVVASSSCTPLSEGAGRRACCAPLPEASSAGPWPVPQT